MHADADAPDELRAADQCKLFHDMLACTDAWLLLLLCHPAVGGGWNSMSKAAAHTSSMAALVGTALVTAKAHNASAPAVH
jgi:hypothetical protein